MEAKVANVPFNSVQLHLLNVFSFTKNDESLKEIRL